MTDDEGLINMTASKFKKRRRMEDTGSLAEIKQDNIEAAKKQESKEQETV